LGCNLFSQLGMASTAPAADTCKIAITELNDPSEACFEIRVAHGLQQSQVIGRNTKAKFIGNQQRVRVCSVQSLTQSRIR